MNHIEETHEILKGLTKLYPEASEELGKFFKIHTSIKHFKLEPFIEPISIVEIENGKTSFITQLTPELLSAWTYHVAGSTITRMNSLESAILSNIIERRLFPCFVLARSHMESASVATYALERLKEVRDHRVATCGRLRSWHLASLAPLAFSSSAGLTSPV